jgi:hypothetical protein
LLALSEAFRLQAVVSRNSSSLDTKPFYTRFFFLGGILMANAPSRRAGTVVTMPTAESLGNQLANLPDHDIAHRAFELYCERGRQHGHDLDDWLQAERELQASVRFHVA